MLTPQQRATVDGIWAERLALEDLENNFRLAAFQAKKDLLLLENVNIKPRQALVWRGEKPSLKIIHKNELLGLDIPHEAADPLRCSK